MIKIAVTANEVKDISWTFQWST